MQTAPESGDRGLIRSGTPMQGRDARDYARIRLGACPQRRRTLGVCPGANNDNAAASAGIPSSGKERLAFTYT
jgi:hypothetical protein